MSGRTRRVVTTLVLVAGLAALPAGPAAAAVERVDMAEFRFTPAKVEIEVSDSVIWEAGDDGHTVTARDGSFDSSYRGMMAEGDQFRWRFRTPGTFAYYCRVHQNRGMQGEVVVVDPYAPMTGTTRLTPVTAAATTSTTFADAATTTTAPATTTSRELATSSSTSPAIATSTTKPVGTPAAPQDAPALNPNAPILDSVTGEPTLPEAQAAARRSGAEDEPAPYLAVGLLAVLAAVAGGAAFRRARRS